MVVAAAPSPADGAPKVLLLSGQPASAAGAPAGQALPLMVPAQRGASPEAASGGLPQARKRQRLTHLSPEEKALRRWVRGRGLGPDLKPGLGAGAGAGAGSGDPTLAVPQGSGAFGLAGRCQRGAGRGRKTGLTGSASPGTQGGRGLFSVLFNSLVRDDQRWGCGHLSSRPSCCVAADRWFSLSELGL